MNRAQGVILAVLGIAAVAGIWFAASGSAARAAEPDGRELAARVAALESAQRPPERVVERTQVVVQADEPSEQKARKEELEGRIEPPPVGVRTDVELAAAYAAEWESEPIDAGWAREARGTYLPSIQKLMPTASELKSFDCRSRFCDLVIVHESSDASNGFLRQLFSLEGPLGRTTGGFRASEPIKTRDGKFEYHVYVARPGTPLALDGATEPPPVE